MSTAAHSRHLNRTIAPTTTAAVTDFNFIRAKHVMSGIQGNRNSKQKALAKKRIDPDENDEEMNLLDDLTKDDSNLHDR